MVLIVVVVVVIVGTDVIQLCFRRRAIQLVRPEQLVQLCGWQLSLQSGCDCSPILQGQSSG